MEAYTLQLFKTTWKGLLILIFCDMKQTSFFLDDDSVEVLEKWFRGKQSLSASVRLAIEKMMRDGVPVRMYGRQQGVCVDGCRVRVSLPNELYDSLSGSFPGLNLSFTLREYLRTQFL